MTERDKLIEQAAEAMRANNRIPEMPVLRSLPDEALRAVIERHTGPFYVA